MKINITFLFLLIISFCITSPLYSDKKTSYLNSAFYYKFYRMRTISRDHYLNKLLNTRFQGRGKITSIEEYDRYRKRFRIKLVDTSSTKYNISIIIYIFLNNEDSVKLLKIDDVFDFKGQLMAYTPLNSKRSSYIFDIILEDGAVVLQ